MFYGSILLIFSSHLGKNTNIVLELYGFVKCLKLAHQYGFNNIIVEGDSSIIIKSSRIIQCGENYDLVSSNWCLFSKYQHILELVGHIPTIVPSHVC